MTPITIGLVGNPNCGKTTLFNALTGAHQRVGNWPGVTVERKSGFFQEQQTMVEVVDLPGTYSLIMASETASIDERIACEYILSGQPDIIVNILDASNLERNLYLALQLIEMQVPMIVVLNMMDVATQRQMQISKEKLQAKLGCPVIAIQAHKGKGIEELKHALVSLSAVNAPTVSSPSFIHPGLLNAIHALAIEMTAAIPPVYQVRAPWLAMRLLEGDVFAEQMMLSNVKPMVTRFQRQIQETLSEDADILVADARYRFIQDILSACLVKSTEQRLTWTARIDSIVLNRVLGIPLFLGVMYVMFLFAINVGGAFQDFFDIGSNTIFVQGLSQLLTTLHAPNWLNAILANGVGRGINTTLTFIPVIGAMFLFLAFLEDSGYMSRAAFVIDRLMRALGLPGKSFVPMIVGFGCNVPSVMATRTLDNKRDRILTVMMSPFMSCGARLAIYAVFTAAFFPVGGQNVVFALYLIGIVMAMLTGLLLRKTVLQGEPSPLVMELPPYHLPHVKTLYLHAWQRLKGFVFRAGKLIVPICVLIGVLSTLNIDGTLNPGDGDASSLLSYLGRMLTPIFAPMGIHQDNWPATVGLVTGVLAKEVVVGTLNELYSQVGHLANLHATGFSFWGGLQDALVSVPHNLRQLGASFGNPVLAQAPVHMLNQSVYGLMYQRFDGQIGAIAYLLFVLLYFPCVSTTAAMLREVNRGWTVFSVFWTTGIAYCVAVFFYQAATFARHPTESLAWMLGIVLVLVLTVFGIKWFVSPVKRLRLQPGGELR
ncbi:MAG: Fe(2+) transporter permease subunit FeoB [Gammaproteobacteria bacterium]|nr:Fe(2+) transporter permease subunit FeoB [Gammaproteobacteria bacterium]